MTGLKTVTDREGRMDVEGTVVAGPEYEPTEGRVVVEDGRIVAVEAAPVASDDLVIPALVDAHTHVGDSVAKEAAVGLGLEAAVAPPDSVKHRRLAAASREELVTAMRRTVRFMGAAGTAAFVDFRESGVAGATALREAVATADADVRATILGSDEPAVLSVADGFGASGANDDDFTALRRTVRESGKPFAIHAGEPDASDIHPALDLEPDLLIHMVHAGPDHLERVAEQSVPVVACPRTNAVLGVGRPPLADLVGATEVALGTDNVMLGPPDLFREMSFVGATTDLDGRTILGMATRAGASVAGLDSGVIEPGRPADLLVLDGDSDNLAGTVDPVEAVVRRAGPSDVRRRIVGRHGDDHEG
jgi:guanine deaminase